MNTVVSSVFFFIVFISCAFSKEVPDITPLTAPLNPAFVKYIKHIRNVERGIPYSLSVSLKGQYPVSGNPPPLDLSHIKGGIDEYVDQIYPSYYDLRNENKVTPFVKSQLGYSCWFHAVYNSLESYLMPGEVRNFDAEILDDYQNHGFTQPLGGDYLMATACLTRWSGPTEDPSEGYTYWRTGTPGSVQKHVQQVVYLPERSGPLDNNTIKWFLMNYGAIYASLRFDSIYHNYATDSYYYNGDKVTNHGFAVVGWDDRFDRNRFSRTPPGDGAFIGRMAWGENFGEDGYFYVSYYDTVFSGDAAFNNAEDARNYGTIYQYDPLGAVISVGLRSTVYWGANIFTAVNDQPLEAVSFYTTDVNTIVKIRIFKDTAGSPIDGLPAASKTAAFTYPGYYTVKLDEVVPLTPGERFAVVIRFENQAFKFPVAIEKPIENYSHKADANPGESFVSADGSTWQDLTVAHPGSNVCIKAFTTAPLFHKAVISCRARKETGSLWLISKLFGVISFTVENIAEVPVVNVLIYRKDNDGSYQEIQVVRSSLLENGSYTFIDEYLEKDVVYTYHVTAYSPGNEIIGRSPEITIY
jgi:C1A family cysteine protease